MMVATLLVVMFGCLLAGIPMFIGMVVAALAVLMIFFPNMGLEVAFQQLYVGVSSYVLLSVPMFILAAEIMCAGQCADRLLALVRSMLGHIPGGLAVTSIGTCTLFGAISGSTQATFVAVGRPMSKEMSKVGYNISHSVGMLMSSANIALLIPPSITMIVYCVVVNASVAELFMAGIGPGILLFLAFSIYEIIYAKRQHIGLVERASFKDFGKALREALLPLGFPVIILGGIYTGVFSPTEAAAVSVLYAFILEKFIYRTITIKDLGRLCINTGVVTAVVFVLVGSGQVFSWVLSFAGIPQAMATSIIGMELSKEVFLAVVALSFMVACMFVDGIPVMYILAPIFAPIAATLGIDPIHLGIVVTMQVAIGNVSPPFGNNIFTAAAIFDLPFIDVIRKLGPYLIICVIVSVMLIVFPDISLLVRDLAF